MAKQGIILLSIIVFSLILVVFLTVFGFSVEQKNSASTPLTLSSYRNTVALFEGERLIKTYEGIVLNVLPERDRQRFDNGIAVASASEAERILEDYDS